MYHRVSQGAGIDMGDREKKPARPLFGPSGEHNRFFGGSLIPVFTRDPYKRYRQSLTSKSYWQRFTAWLRYYSIQFRWDIERRLARLLHRRWGDQF